MKNLFSETQMLISRAPSKNVVFKLCWLYFFKAFGFYFTASEYTWSKRAVLMYMSTANSILNADKQGDLA